MSSQLNIVAHSRRDPSIVPSPSLSSVIKNITSRLETCASPNSNLREKNILFKTGFGTDRPLCGWKSDGLLSQVLQLPESTRHAIVASVDSSCIVIGETDVGTVFAGRTAVVFAQGGSVVTYVRSGPLLFYIDKDGIESDFPLSSVKMLMLALRDSRIGESIIRSYLERVLHLELSKSLSQSIVVADGSLQNSHTSDELSFQNIVRAARLKNNSILGLSKASKLKELSPFGSTLSELKRKMVAVEVTELLKGVNPTFRGMSYIVKFTDDPNVFRCDTVGRSEEEALSDLSTFRLNDMFFRGYPESLRLAHHLCIFNTADASSIRSYLCKSYSVRRLPSEDLRKIILGRI